MPLAPQKFCWTYADLQKLTGKKRNTIHQATTRGELDPNRLKSVVAYTLRHARPKLRMELLRYALEVGLPKRRP